MRSWSSSDYPVTEEQWLEGHERGVWAEPQAAGKGVCPSSHGTSTTVQWQDPSAASKGQWQDPVVAGKGVYPQDWQPPGATGKGVCPSSHGLYPNPYLPPPHYVLHNTLAAPTTPHIDGLWQSAFAQGYEKGYGKGHADGKRSATEADVADLGSDVGSTHGKSKKKKSTGESKKWEAAFKERYPEEADLKHPHVYECFCGEAEG